MVLVLLGGIPLLSAHIHAQRTRTRKTALQMLNRQPVGDARALHTAVYASYLPRADGLEWLAVGNKNVAAFLTQIQVFGYVSENIVRQRSDRHMIWLDHMLRVMRELDPNNKSHFRLSVILLHALNHKPGRALQVLEEAQERWPDTYLFFYDAAAICLLHPALEDKAAEYLSEAIQRPDCPPHLRSLANELLTREDHLDVALRITHERLGTLPTEGHHFDRSVKDMLKLATRKMVNTARNGVDRFEEVKGRLPRNLQELVKAADDEGRPLLSRKELQKLDPLARDGLMPLTQEGRAKTALQLIHEGRDAFGLELRYAPDTPEKVHSKSLYIEEMHGGRLLLEAALEWVLAEDLGTPRTPEDVTELAREAMKKRGAEEIPPPVRDYLGVNLDWPFEGRLEIDTQSGEVRTVNLDEVRRLREIAAERSKVWKALRKKAGL
ncbi:MAG: hypothetical protein ACOCWR_11570 [Oceanidesulfovibrio sp.]